MQHGFRHKQLDKLTCVTCNRAFLDHTPLAHCESCGKQATCDIRGKLDDPRAMLLCADCEAKENAINDATLLRTKTLREERNELASNPQLTYQGDYFNWHPKPIVEQKEFYEVTSDTPFESFHEAIKQQMLNFEHVLFNTSIDAPHNGSISRLVVEFRVEIRKHYKDVDIEYQPPSKAPKVKVPRPSSPSSQVEVKPRKKIDMLEKMAMLHVDANLKQGNIITLQDAILKIKRDLGIVD